MTVGRVWKVVWRGVAWRGVVWRGVVYARCAQLIVWHD